ncbi:hypothetical protein AB9M93_26230 [Peribacillus frigoritolerans]|uniref:hypothetical protein n=1 Tax=Peribacillus frigoritolerans TaxID=450367 RepID=UPI0035141D03
MEKKFRAKINELQNQRNETTKDELNKRLDEAIILTKTSYEIYKKLHNKKNKVKGTVTLEPLLKLESLSNQYPIDKNYIKPEYLKIHEENMELAKVVVKKQLKLLDFINEETFNINKILIEYHEFTLEKIYSTLINNDNQNSALIEIYDNVKEIIYSDEVKELVGMYSEIIKEVLEISEIVDSYFELKKSIDEIIDNSNMITDEKLLELTNGYSKTISVWIKVAEVL